MGNQKSTTVPPKAAKSRVVKGDVPQTPNIPVATRVHPQGMPLKIRIVDSLASVRAVYSVDKTPIGRGHYGVVRKCTHRETGQVYAVKTINKAKTENPTMLKREVNILKELKHPYILELVDVFEDDKYLHLVTELCTGGELFDLIVAKSNEEESDSACFSEVAAARIMHDSLNAIVYCHERGIVHRDIKPENFLLATDASDSHIKLIDFGLSRRTSSFHRMHSKVGTPYYVAPEVLRENYTKACDVWSLGVIAYILLCGYPPFHGDNDAQVFRKIKSGIFDFPSPEWDHISEEAKAFIQSILQLDPDKRVTARQALESDWMRHQLPEFDRSVLELSSRQHSTHQLRRTNQFSQFLAIQKLKKATLGYIAAHLTQDDIVTLKEAFKEIDKNKDGFVTMDELRTVIDTGEGIQRSSGLLAEVREHASSLDLSDTAPLDYDHFVELMLEHSESLREANVRRTFEHFQQNHDVSCLTLEDLTEILGSQAQATEVMSAMDVDHQDKVSFEGFHSAFL